MELGTLTHAQLKFVVDELEKHVEKDVFDRVIQKALKPKQKRKEKHRAFDPTKYMKRHIALKFSYMGERFQGFARQKNTEETVERYLIDALVQTKLIESIDSVEYSRAGRTDKGVSAFGQVVSLWVRSNVPCDAELCDNNARIDDLVPGKTLRVRLPCGRIRNIQEVEYCKRLNRSLPHDIIVRAWAPAPPSFDARFSALYRTYRYFFLPDGLNVDNMILGAKKLIGSHDFRHFCRVDPDATTTFVRHIYMFRVVRERDICYFEICGNAFLWHQVRCMVAILFLIGKGLEQPDLIPGMLDVEKIKQKPQYDMASDLPLILYDCVYENIDWCYQPQVLQHIELELRQQREGMLVRHALLGTKIDGIERILVPSPEGRHEKWSDVRCSFPVRKRKPHLLLLRSAKRNASGKEN